MSLKQYVLDTFNGEAIKDEFEKQHSHRVLAQNFSWLFWGLILLLNVSFWIKFYFEQLPVVEGLGLLLFLTLAMMIEVKLKQQYANVLEIDDEQTYRKTLRKLKRSSILFGIMMMSVMMILNMVILPIFILDTSFSMTDFIRNGLIALGTSILTGIMLYFYSKYKVKRTYDEE
ncbi:hypothetical protein [Staphylococcus sp. 17KM0847]|uniref:hypothetical protein n=1 Tax=Staphylococcus sp. 17KM0847 TaxID=2583989 RepID=UPI0015DBEEF4|nr:hypothetical protein [Staphylococcus sp. 17KM0847]QLK86699.1 hypothetical protein FGL66_08360 [Staphylococcus sp. 17KM0847]